MGSSKDVSAHVQVTETITEVEKVEAEAGMVPSAAVVHSRVQELTIQKLQLAPRSQAGNQALTRSARRNLFVVPANPQEPFTPMLSWSQHKHFSLREGFRTVQSSAGLLLSFAGVPVGSAGGVLLLGGSPSILASNFFIAGFGAVVVFGSNAWRAVRASTRDVEELHRLAAERFAAWIQQRHGIKVNVETLAQSLGCELLYNQQREVHLKFKSEGGTAYALVGDGQHFRIERHVPKAKKCKAKAKQLGPKELGLEPLVSGSKFSNEASMLIQQIGELLAKLQRQVLLIEYEHVVKRVQEDVLGLARLNEQLHELDGPSEADEKRFASTLLMLRGELKEILDQQHAALSMEIAVTETYVKDRQASIPRLTLEK